MEIIKKHKGLFLLALVVLVGFSLFYRMHHHDREALTNFSVAYKKFDFAISDFSRAVLTSNFQAGFAFDDLEDKAEEALVDLKANASVRISSLVENDAELMNTILKIADLSAKELADLKEYRKAIAEKNVSLDRLAKEFGDWEHQRQTAYALFRKLSGLKD